MTAATSTSLTAVVPPGATKGPVSVSVGCNTINSGTNFTVASSCIPSTEHDALVAIYNSTNGGSWANNSNWLNGNEATWYGVTITSCHITDLSLNGNNLIGTIPSEIGDLAMLNVLDLSSNQLSGPIPPQISNLSSLTSAFLGNNQFSGSPPLIGGSAMNALELQLNQLTGLPNLSAYPSINSVNVSDNQLTFDDIEPYVALPNFTYSPRRSSPLAASFHFWRAAHSPFLLLPVVPPTFINGTKTMLPLLVQRQLL